MPAPAALPSFWEYQAPPAWQAVDFISDLHLCAEMPATFDAWAAYMRATTADAVFILGDLFEVWVGDDARSQPFERRCADILADAAAHRSVGFMVGNRDFLVGSSLLAECGVIALPDPTVLLVFGQRILLSHGDALCLSDVAYQQFRRQVRNEAWQRQFLALPLAQRQAMARQLRDASEQRKSQADRLDWPDIDAATAVQWMHACGCRILIHGHTHMPGSEPLAPGHVRHVLSDWDLDQAEPPGRAQVLRLTAKGLARLSPAALPVVPRPA